MKPSVFASVLFPFMVVPAIASRPAKSCTDYTIPLTITSTNHVLSTSFQDDFQLVDFLTELTSRDNTSANPFTSQKEQTASYSISATFCTPSDTASKENTLLVLTHGLGFDRSYWNPGVNPEQYSFVDFAIGKGYSVFFYDRLGVGDSSTVSGYVNQGSIQVAILQSLVKSIRSGEYIGSGKRPEKLVLVGHSFGSAISAGALTLEPDLADGLILTGFSYSDINASGFAQASGLRIAAAQQPSRFGHLDNGYITPVDLFANVHCFFKANDYDPAFAAYIDSTKQPFAVSEMASSAVLPSMPVNFRGAAMVITGQYDFIFCTSQCDDVLEPGAAPIFNKARAFSAVSYPGAGHALNLASNAQGSFELITDFLDKHV